MKQPKWQFASTGGGFEEGINNPLIEHFEGDHNYYLAREVIQNSIDARLDHNNPVKVIFRLCFLPKQEFPGIEDFKEILNNCLLTHENDSKTRGFFENAIKVVERDRIPALVVSDYNTQGLDGSETERSKPWYRLVKSRGVSGKVSGEGGSFGIGKGAAYAASELRTVFYSTKSNKDAKSRFIGTSLLVNFDKDNDTKQAAGTYGMDKQSTIYEPNLMGEFWRKVSGLDIHIMGYKAGKDWRAQLTKSVLRNFWYAILNEDLEVDIDGESMQFSTLEELLVKYFANEPLKDYYEPRGNPLYFYRAVMDNRAKKFTQNLNHIGECTFHFIQLEENMNYVAMMRKSHMVIYSKTFHFASPYAGVFICSDKKGNMELKNMEPPAHDKWDANRNELNGKKIMDVIEQWIRSCLKQVKEEKKDETSNIPDLEKYLPLSEETETGKPTGAESDPVESDSEETRRLVSSASTFITTGTISPYKVSVLNKRDKGVGGLGTHIKEGPDRGGKKSKSVSGDGIGDVPAFKVEGIRARIIGKSRSFEEQQYLVSLCSEKEVKCELKFFAIGEESPSKVKIKKVVDSRNINYKITNNCIKGFYLERGKDIRINVFLENKVKCSLIVEAYEIR